MSGLLDMSDTTIAGNSYLLTSDIIIGSES
jgi:hypothetical protein